MDFRLPKTLGADDKSFTTTKIPYATLYQRGWKSSHLKDTDIVSCVGWTGNNELYSFGDDRKIFRWSGDGEFLGPISTVLFDVGASSPTKANASGTTPTSAGSGGGTVASGLATADPNAGSVFFVTEMHWFPVAPGKSQSAGAEMYAVGGSNAEYLLGTGRFYFCSKNGRVEKAVDAHKGALLGLRWNYEGSALLTAGEDGQVKIWSRSGMLRSTLIQLGYPIYSAVWSPENDQVLLTNGRNLIIKPLQPSNKPNQWKAHDGVILKVDWNLANNLIVSGAEDRKYKVHDTYGRCLYSSMPHDHPITSVSWSPSGEMFAVGSFDVLRVCDRSGWSYALSSTDAGSLFNIAWTPDGTQIACASGSGAVVFGHIINRRLEWKNYEVTLLDIHKIRVMDVINGTTENLEFRDRVIQASLSFGYLVVATSSQIYVYSERNWNTPSITDLPGGGRVNGIQQCAEYFLIVDTVAGIQIFTYDARPMSSPKYPGLRPEFLHMQTLALSGDVVAVRDRADEKAIYLFDVATGKPLQNISQEGAGQGQQQQPGIIRHSVEVVEMALSQASASGGSSNTSASGGSGSVAAAGGLSHRMLAVIDKNRDLWITPVLKPQFKKIGTMVDTFAWNAESDLIAAMVDGKFVVWYYPYAVFVDEDIAPLTRFDRDGNNISPLPALLQEHARKKQWEEAVRLCRFAKSQELWACLAAMAINGQDLNTAEVAYAAIDEAAKVQYICHIRSIPTMEGRLAELALLRRRPREAEAILVAANLVYRALRMWITLFQWERALELAVKYKSHVDMVLHFRNEYLKAMGRKETNKKFIHYAQGVEVDFEKIKAKMAAEEENEQKRPGARPYQ
ncbi:Intraflagellar transport protein 80 [Quaeritorhiza haematococci]|nr:Intraflagellar transport protein 80 [Quaeritorhiza haematococci]